MLEMKRYQVINERYIRDIDDDDVEIIKNDDEKPKASRYLLVQYHPDSSQEVELEDMYDLLNSFFSSQRILSYYSIGNPYIQNVDKSVDIQFNGWDKSFNHWYLVHDYLEEHNLSNRLATSINFKIWYELNNKFSFKNFCKFIFNLTYKMKQFISAADYNTFNCWVHFMNYDDKYTVDNDHKVVMDGRFMNEDKCMNLYKALSVNKLNTEMNVFSYWDVYDNSCMRTVKRLVTDVNDCCSSCQLAVNNFMYKPVEDGECSYISMVAEGDINQEDVVKSILNAVKEDITSDLLSDNLFFIIVKPNGPTSWCDAKYIDTPQGLRCTSVKGDSHNGVLYRIQKYAQQSFYILFTNRKGLCEKTLGVGDTAKFIDQKVNTNQIWL